ncbi:unnamed protein product, partial [Prorocentrum cordatum]
KIIGGMHPPQSPLGAVPGFARARPQGVGFAHWPLAMNRMRCGERHAGPRAWTRRRPGAHMPTSPPDAALNHLACAARKKQKVHCKDVALLARAVLAASDAAEDDHVTANGADVQPYAQEPSSRRPCFQQRLTECKYVVVEVQERDHFDRCYHQRDQQSDHCDNLYGVGGFHQHY